MSSWVEDLTPGQWAEVAADAVRPFLAGALPVCEVRVRPLDMEAWALLRGRLRGDGARVAAPWSLRKAPPDLVEVWARVAEDVALGVDWVERHTVVLRPPGFSDGAFAIYERLRLDGTDMGVAFEAAELLGVGS